MSKIFLIFRGDLNRKLILVFVLIVMSVNKKQISDDKNFTEVFLESLYLVLHVAKCVRV